jgi:hypothetical protein
VINERAQSSNMARVQSKLVASAELARDPVAGCRVASTRVMATHELKQRQPPDAHL